MDREPDQTITAKQQTFKKTRSIDPRPEIRRQKTRKLEREREREGRKEGGLKKRVATRRRKEQKIPNVWICYVNKSWTNLGCLSSIFSPNTSLLLFLFVMLSTKNKTQRKRKKENSFLYMQQHMQRCLCDDEKKKITITNTNKQTNKTKSTYLPPRIDKLSVARVGFCSQPAESNNARKYQSV